MRAYIFMASVKYYVFFRINLFIFFLYILYLYLKHVRYIFFLYICKLNNLINNKFNKKLKNSNFIFQICTVLIYSRYLLLTKISLLKKNIYIIYLMYKVIQLIIYGENPMVTPRVNFTLIVFLYAE